MLLGYSWMRFTITTYKLVICLLCFELRSSILTKSAASSLWRDLKLFDRFGGYQPIKITSPAANKTG